MVLLWHQSSEALPESAADHTAVLRKKDKAKAGIKKEL
jgi:hypothetical protein